MPPRLQSEQFGNAISHGFFGRTGGVSTGIYASLNCGPGSDDAADAVAENRRLCQQALGAEALTTAYQIHSSDAVFTDAPFADLPKADAIVTTTPGLAIGIMTADCMPVLLADEEARVIGAAHAGWRGALAGVLENTVALMQEHGARTEHIKACMGPCLQQTNFEVGLDLVEAFTDKYPQAEQFFIPGGSPEKRQCNLTAFGQWRLEASGLLPEHIHPLGVCTLGEPDAYFSYRHSRQTGASGYGRNLSAISLKANT
jgi:hypothetical protein